MKIIKRLSTEIPIEAAHGGSGARKIYATPEHVNSIHFEMMTHGFLPAGQVFDWHDHRDTEEIMVVLKGAGVVSDEDGDYSYSAGDVFVFPANIRHKIANNSTD